MGVFNDLWRLTKAGVAQTARTDYAENLRQSADLAEQFAGKDPNAPLGTHGAATANPFTNLSMFASMIQGSGTVVALHDTGGRIGLDAIYAVDLDITLPGAEPYRTVYKTVIAQAALPNWQPGAMYPFRVSPTDRDAVMLG
ncbi:hypothetical protein ACEXOS_007735 [Herbiconiux sp. P16]|uniref:hypothetical protein n=1 Tax=Herbiconiux wuyangfengii TaxID=3342794 RepID=UPI0035B85A66